MNNKSWAIVLQSAELQDIPFTFFSLRALKDQHFHMNVKKNNNNTEMLIFQTNILAALVIFHFIFACPLSVAHVFFLIT